MGDTTGKYTKGLHARGALELFTEFRFPFLCILAFGYIGKAWYQRTIDVPQMCRNTGHPMPMLSQRGRNGDLAIVTSTKGVAAQVSSKSNAKQTQIYWP